MDRSQASLDSSKLQPLVIKEGRMSLQENCSSTNLFVACDQSVSYVHCAKELLSICN